MSDFEEVKAEKSRKTRKKAAKRKRSSPDQMLLKKKMQALSKALCADLAKLQQKIKKLTKG